MTATAVTGPDDTSDEHTVDRPGPGRTTQTTPTVRRVRLIGVALALVVLAFLQKPGEIAADTKLDLVVDPLAFLGRALGLWDPTGYAGQLQNQAYGYVFPMGSFFALGDILHIDAWMVQRLWFAALLVGAWGGTYRLLNALRIGTPTVRVIAALTYALAPRMLTELGGISAEVIPFAVAPWVLTPLVLGARRGSPRRAAAASGVAFLFAGGVNAAAAIAILPLPAWWLLTRAKGKRKNQLIRWWVLAIGLASLWWVVPLLVLGRYSPPFLDWIESSAFTTSATSLIESWRGTTQWVARIAGPDGPEWTAGWVLLTAPAAIIATVLVAAVGLVGAVQRSNPHRLFLGGGLVIGLALITFGHTGPLAPPWAPFAQDLLDGPLSPFRNIHKFDPVIRLMLSLGLAHLLAAIRPLRGIQWRDLPVAALVRIAVAAMLLVSAVPAVSGDLVNRSRPTEYPTYWADTADWLAENAGESRGLVVPGAPFGLYYWGRTNDDVLQPLAKSGWLVRDGVPLSSAGNIRLLDAFDQLLADGQPSAGLATALAGAGIGYVVVRNDLDWRRGRATRPELVHEALDGSPGLERVKAFGPELTVAGDLVDRKLYDPKVAAYRAVEIYRVTGVPATVRSVPLENVLRMAGGPEATLSLAEQGLQVGRPSVLAGDDRLLGDGVGTPVVTDTLRRREVNFGEVRHNVSATMTEDEPFIADRSAHDYLNSDDPSLLTVARYSGVSGFRASSSGSDVDAAVSHDAAHAPWFAVDGDPRSSWATGSPGAVGQWLELRFDHDVDLTSITVQFDAALKLGPMPTRLEVTTDAGSRPVDVRPTGDPQRIDVPAGTTSRLRLTVRDVDGDPAKAGGVAISEITVPGIRPTRTLVTPPVTGTNPAIVVFRAATSGHGDCLTFDERPVCLPGLSTPAEEPTGLDRTFTLPAKADYAVTIAGQPISGDALDALLAPEEDDAAIASSEDTGYNDPRTRPQAVFDGDPDTVWIAAPGVQAPKLTVTLPERRRITGLTLRLDGTATAAPPRTLQVTSDTGQTQFGTVVPNGVTGSVRFAKPLTGREFEVTVVETAPVATTNAANGFQELLPPGIAELQLVGAEDTVKSVPADTVVDLPCGKGPTLRIDGRTVPTRVVGPATGTRADTQLEGAAKQRPLTVGDLLEERPVKIEPCADDGRPGADLELSAGEHRLQLVGTDNLRPVSVMMAPLGATGIRSAQRTADVRDWGSTSRSVDLGPSDRPSVLVVPENYNEGWVAKLTGQKLVPIRVDGWQQAWIVPAGDGGTVTLSYRPKWIYWGGLLAGLLAVIALLALARWGRPLGRTTPATAEAGSPEALEPVGAGRTPLARRLPLFLPAVIGGMPGLIGTAVLWLVVRKLRRGRALVRWLPLVGGTALVAAGIASAYRPFAGEHEPWADSWPVQALCLAAVVIVAVVAVHPTSAEDAPEKLTGDE
ncbi:alpha-(1-_3)-arabinofuranosyltransferase [Cryptosporangium arvum]|uniref:alpha-(1->3)-arabinofuranosyltransferase n=1 Tax=Cryptosporangium arvum TaxID=80871 RepID=UPI0004B94CA9|nr:alpha-(1->3)-arabinofuranosyltransferase [Cryptosporangium arvum]